MKKILLSFIIFYTVTASAQNAKIYFPEQNAEKLIALYLKSAKEQKKFLLIQAGGNWCKWCMEFERFVSTTPSIDSVIRSAFVVYHLNYSKENMNPKTFAKLGYPQRFGFPVFIILDEKGNRIHTQNSEYLEDQKSSYNKEKVQAFLEMWSPRALNPAMYGN